MLSAHEYSYVDGMLARATVLDKSRVLALCEQLPTRPMQIAAWVHEGGLDRNAPPSALFVEPEGGLAFVSDLGVIMPHLIRGESVEELAHRIGTPAARVVVGPTWAARILWTTLEQRGCRARIVRDQVGYAVSRESFKAEAKHETLPLRAATLADLDGLVSASAAMAVEESKDDPARRNPGLFRSRIADRIRKGRDFVLIENGRLLFKVNVAALSPFGGHIEGVYTAPKARGRGIGRAGTAWITNWILQRGALATLLVNKDNRVARQIYEGLGFVPTYESRTILAR